MQRTFQTSTGEFDERDYIQLQAERLVNETADLVHKEIVGQKPSRQLVYGIVREIAKKAEKMALEYRGSVADWENG